MILNCSSYETAKNSLAKIFNVSDDELVSVLQDVNLFDHCSLAPEDALFEHVCNMIGDPLDNISVMWFHATRIEDKNLFYKHGILTKTEAKKFIEPRLKEMTDGLKRSGSNPFSTSLSGKNGPHDEGPFAFLIRDVAIQAPSPCHNYLDAPEMVEDIAGTLLGQNYIQLVNRFKDITSPYIVSFLASSKGYELPHVLLYIKLIIDGETDLGAGAAANTFFDSEGMSISPDRIQNIELIQGAECVSAHNDDFS